MKYQKIECVTLNLSQVFSHLWCLVHLNQIMVHFPDGGVHLYNNVTY